MISRFMTIAAFAALGTLALAPVARADCEEDLVQLEDAYKAPNLAPTAKAAFDDAKTQAVKAMKKDDDDTCHKVIGEAFAKAGITLK